jgi:hypothetical protein
MSTAITVIVHDVEADGLPDMTELTGRVAFLTEGVVVSGWPLIRGPKERRWEADPDVFGCCPPPVAGVTTWLEFPVPVEELTGG